MVKFWLARLDNANVAASIELIYKEVIFGWYGGVDRAYSSHTPSEFLTWHILNWALKMVSANTILAGPECRMKSMVFEILKRNSEGNWSVMAVIPASTRPPC